MQRLSSTSGHITDVPAAPYASVSRTSMRTTRLQVLASRGTETPPTLISHCPTSRTRPQPSRGHARARVKRCASQRARCLRAPQTKARTPLGSQPASAVRADCVGPSARRCHPGPLPRPPPPPDSRAIWPDPGLQLTPRRESNSEAGASFAGLTAPRADGDAALHRGRSQGSAISKLPR